MSSTTGWRIVAGRRGARLARRASPGPATATNGGPPAPDLDELAPGSRGRPPRPSPRRGRARPARGGRRAARRPGRPSSRSHARTCGRPRRRRDEPDVGDVAPERGRERPPRPRSPWVATTTYGGASSSRTGRGPRSPSTRSAPGNASVSATGSNRLTRQPVAAPSATRAPGDRRRAGDPEVRARAGAVPRRSPACRPSGRS